MNPDDIVAAVAGALANYMPNDGPAVRRLAAQAAVDAMSRYLLANRLSAMAPLIYPQGLPPRYGTQCSAPVEQPHDFGLFSD